MAKQMKWIIFACLLAVLSVALALALAGCDGQDPIVETQAQLWTRGTQHTFHSAVVTNTNGTAMDVDSYPSLGIQVQGITTATVNFESTIDGTNWAAHEVVNIANGSKSTSTTADGKFRTPVGEVRKLRCRISGYSGGTITVKGNAPVEASYGLEDVQLGAAADPTYIGDVEITASPTVTNITGAAAIDVDYAPGSAFWLESVTLNLSAAPTTSQNFTIVLDAGDGAAYDTTLYSGDLSVLGGGTTDLVYQPGLEMLFEPTDALDVDFTNTDTVTYGLRIVVRLAE